MEEDHNKGANQVEWIVVQFEKDMPDTNKATRPSRDSLEYLSLVGQDRLLPQLIVIQKTPTRWIHRLVGQSSTTIFYIYIYSYFQKICILTSTFTYIFPPATELT